MLDHAKDALYDLLKAAIRKELGSVTVGQEGRGLVR